MVARTWRDLDDLNAPALSWCQGAGAERCCPEDRLRLVKEAFGDERARLRSLPEHLFPIEDLLPVAVGKTPYARFDGNDYSVPHDRVRRTLSVQATPDTVRLLDGTQEVARHARSWGRGHQSRTRPTSPRWSPKSSVHRSPAGSTDSLRPSPALAHQGVLRGFSVRFTTASAMLNDLASQDGSRALTRALARYCRPRILVVDEVGYLSYGTRHADLLFEVVTRRYEERSIVLSTNRPFAAWNEVFPSATCVATLVDRLVHRSAVILIEADSYRLREARERASRKGKAKGRAV